MAEAVGRAVPLRQVDHDMRAFGFLNGIEHDVFTSDHVRQRAELEVPSEHSSVLQDGPRGGRETSEPLLDDEPDGGGNFDRVERDIRAEPPALVEERSGIREVTK